MTCLLVAQRGRGHGSPAGHRKTAEDGRGQAVGARRIGRRDPSDIRRAAIPGYRRPRTPRPAPPRQWPPDPTDQRALARGSAERRRWRLQERAIARCRIDPAAELHLDLARPAPPSPGARTAPGPDHRRRSRAATGARASPARSAALRSAGDTLSADRSGRETAASPTSTTGALPMAASACRDSRRQRPHAIRREPMPHVLADACARTASRRLHTSGCSELAPLPPVVLHHRDRAEATATASGRTSPDTPVRTGGRRAVRAERPVSCHR